MKREIIEAVNDWPKHLSDFDDYLKQLRGFLNKKTISISVIYQARTKIDPARYGWEIESIESLYRFMSMNSADNLEQLFSTLKKYV